MDKKKKYKISNLSHVLQIGKKTEEEDEYWSNGYFDEQMNYYYGYMDDPYVLWPWELVLFPEIVEYAKKLGIEIPENPEIDLSKTF